MQPRMRCNPRVTSNSSRRHEGESRERNDAGQRIEGHSRPRRCGSQRARAARSRSKHAVLAAALGAGARKRKVVLVIHRTQGAVRRIATRTSRLSEELLLTLFTGDAERAANKVFSFVAPRWRSINLTTEKRELLDNERLND